MATIADYEEYERKIAALNLLRAEVLLLNKADLFAALDSTGVDSIIVGFDGSGDSGQMEDIDAFNANSETIDLPDIKMEFREITFKTLKIALQSQPLREVLESITYELLERTHDGWENGDGAEATFTFKVSERTITLDYHERYISTNYSQHEF